MCAMFQIVDLSSCSKNLNFTGRLESALAQLGPDPVQTGLRKSLPENMCSLTDVPEDYINGMDLRQVKVGLR